MKNNQKIPVSILADREVFDYLKEKESLHIFNTGKNAKQMISIGARHNTYHLFTSEITIERKWWNFCQFIGVMCHWYR